MSYLTLPAGIPDFSSAVISLWFRVPKESVVNSPGTLPLATFGKPQQHQDYLRPTRNVAVLHPHSLGLNEPDPSTTYWADYYETGPTYEVVEPTLIGLHCYSDGTFGVMIHIQTQDRMSLSATTFITTKMDIWASGDPAGPGGTIPAPGNKILHVYPHAMIATIQDVSHVVSDSQPEYFTVISPTKLQPDRWHHLLLSFDISGVVSIGTPFASSECRLWYAIDDVDYRGPENLQPYRELEGSLRGEDDLDPNAIITRNASAYSGSDPNWEAIHYYQNHYVGLPSGTLSNATIPSGDGEIGIPAASQYVDGILRVEMAEFQMWTGVTLDTGIVANRRAFIDEDGKPEPPATAEDMMGVRPEILLHRSGNWKKGKNTGSRGMDDEGELIPSGQFQPVAGIETWRPDPSLHGRQGPQTESDAGL